ncbi:MAG TPA: BTAD domain-containing putative transcriptional regulator [Longimicrobium sp.]|nr:BTAD domain-containing putative transcriptional regulator [Longimicrobium sp.]
MLSLTLLGDPALSGPGGPVTGRAIYRRRLALLAVLAVARGRPVGRERLLALLWPELSAEAARHNLSETLYVLRKELGEEVVTSLGDEVALNPAALRSDVAEFQAALEEGRREDAVRAYGGPLLDGFHVSDAPDFERWVDAERDRLARAYARALEELAAGAEGSGDPVGAAGWWRRLAAHDPYSSRVVLRLARALDAAGERAPALRAAAAHATFLREELGVEPDAELADFVARLRAEPPRPPPPPPVDAPPAPVNAPAAAVDAAGPLDEAAAPAPTPEPAGIPPPARRRRWRSSRAAAYLGGLTGVLVLAAVLAVARAPAPHPAAPAPRYDPLRVAVLYFDDNTPGDSLAYLADGLTETLIDRLSEVAALHVVSANGVRRYRDARVPFDSIVGELGAGSLVGGSIQRSGDSVRVTVRLIDGESAKHLESRTLVAPRGELFALEDELADGVAGFLRRRLGEEVRLRDTWRGTRSARAAELVLRAEKARDDARRTAGGADAALAALAQADTLLARAEALDGRWVEPPVLRGWVALDRAVLVAGPRRIGTLEAALGHAGRALRLREGHAGALEVRGTAAWRLIVEAPERATESGWMEAAGRDLRGAVEADPRLATAWSTLSQFLRFTGRPAEAERAAARALEEDAFLVAPEVGTERLFRAALVLEQYGRAREWCRAGRRRFPADYRFVECELTLLARDASAGASPDSAWRLVRSIERLDPPARARTAGRAYAPVYRRMMAAAVLARAGERDSARALVARARAATRDEPELRVSLLYDEAYVQWLLGDVGRAAALLDTFATAQPGLRDYLTRDPLFRWRPSR